MSSVSARKEQKSSEALSSMTLSIFKENGFSHGDDCIELRERYIRILRAHGFNIKEIHSNEKSSAGKQV